MTANVNEEEIQHLEETHLLEEIFINRNQITFTGPATAIGLEQLMQQMNQLTQQIEQYPSITTSTVIPTFSSQQNPKPNSIEQLSGQEIFHKMFW